MPNISKLRLSEELYNIVYNDTAILNRLDNIENSIQSTKEEIETNVANTYFPKTGGVIDGNTWVTGFAIQNGIESLGIGDAPEGKWVLIATLRTTYQYADAIMRSIIFTRQDSWAYSESTTIHCRLKQQNLMGEAPLFSIRIINSDGFEENNFAGRIVTNTTSLTEMNIYVNIDVIYRNIVHCPICTAGDVVIYSDLNTLLAAPPTTTYSCSGTLVSSPSASSAASF